METSIEILQDTSGIVEPDLDSIEYNTDIFLPEWMRGEEDQNNELTIWEQILIGLGIALQFMAFILSMLIGRFYYAIGFVLSFAMQVVYIWSVVTWVNAL